MDESKEGTALKAGVFIRALVKDLQNIDEHPHSMEKRQMFAGLDEALERVTRRLEGTAAQFREAVNDGEFKR